MKKRYNPGTLIKTSITTVSYEEGKEPSLQINVERKKRVAGSFIRLPEDEIQIHGHSLDKVDYIKPTTKKASFLERFKLAYTAFTSAEKKGGLKGSEVMDINDMIAEYNSEVKQYNTLLKKETIEEVKKEEVTIKEALSGLEKKSLLE